MAELLLSVKTDPQQPAGPRRPSYLVILMGVAALTAFVMISITVYIYI